MGTILAAIVMIFVANAYFTTLGGSFQLLKSSRTAQQAQQFAEIEANTLKLKDYDEIDSLAHPRRSLIGVISGHTGTPAFSGAFSWHSVHYRGSLIGACLM